MGQEQSYSHASVGQSANRYKEKYETPYRSTQLDYRSSYEESYKRHKPRRSVDSYKSDNSSTESSGYRSGSSACECRSTSDYYTTSLYKNDHYKDINKELYKPVKIPKEKRYKLQLFDLQKEELKSARLKSYLSEAEKAKLKAGPGTAQKKTGIRNYTPKILEEEQRKKDWI